MMLSLCALGAVVGGRGPGSWHRPDCSSVSEGMAEGLPTARHEAQECKVELGGL